MTATCKPLDLAQFEGHTPGPWHVGMKPGPMVYANQHGTQVADCSFDNGGAHRTDARLIAAAPALLAECKRQREQIAKLQEENDTLATGNLKVQVAAGKRNRALENALRPIVERLEWNGRRQGWDIRADLPAGSVEQARAALAAADKGVA